MSEVEAVKQTKIHCIDPHRHIKHIHIRKSCHCQVLHVCCERHRPDARSVLGDLICEVKAATIEDVVVDVAANFAKTQPGMIVCNNPCIGIGVIPYHSYGL